MTFLRIIPDKRTLLLALTAFAVFAPDGAAQPTAPLPPQEYKAIVRYRIRAARNERVAQYLRMLDYFESVGFKKDPGPDNEAEDANLTRLSGTISSSNARKLLLERHVRSVVLIPAGYERPVDAEKPVKVSVELVPALAPQRQSRLEDEVRTRMEDLGFRAFVGYDNRGHTRLVGRIPAGKVEALLDDLRWQGTGWLVPNVPVAALPAPLNALWPVRVVEVLPDSDGVSDAKEAPAPALAPAAGNLLKITPELRALMAQEGQVGKPTRVQLILATTPSPDDPTWRRQLMLAAPGLMIEGRLGQIISVLASPAQAPALADLPIVSTIRLPRAVVQQVQVPAEAPKENTQLLRESGVARWHEAGRHGRGVRLAVIDTDFRGYERFVGKELPAETRYLDLTAERSTDVQPEPFLGEAAATGHGTQTALAAALAAPEASLTLIRVAADAPYQLLTVARAIGGEALDSESLDRRGEQLTEETEDLRIRRADLLRERKVVLDTFSQDEAAVKRRQEYFKKQAELDRDELALERRQARYLRLVQDLRDLRGIQVVANTLVWNEGYPADGTSALSRYFDDEPFKAALWLQATGNTRGQSWTGLFRDADDNGVMEFATGGRLAGRWTSELNFLAWQPLQGERTPDLPAKATVRVSIQWSEPHDSELLRRGEDLYRRPLADLRLIVLRQLDPKGEKVSSDELDVVARSLGWPQRLRNEGNYAAYEQTVEFTAETAGRFVLRIEGRVPNSLRPADVPTLPALQQSWELWPRVFLNVLDEASRSAGRPVFADYAPDLGGVAMPADARSVRSIGAANPAGEARSYSATGPASGLDLLPKPDVLSFDGLLVQGQQPAFGTGPATGFAAGMAAVFANGARDQSPPRHTPWKPQPGSLLRLP